MADTPHDGTGTLFVFNGTTFTVTNVVYDLKDPSATEKLDVSHLGQTTGESVATIDKPLKGSVSDTGRQITFQYQGKGVIADAVSGALVITIGGAAWLSKNATVASSQVTLATNDIIKGNAVLRVAR